MQTEFLTKEHLKGDIWLFEFKKPANFDFIAGDFCELELGDEIHGGARWLTIACAPDYKNLQFVTKIPDQPSDFKKTLSELKKGQKVWLSPALGLFHLPRKTDEKVLFIALGLGITPYKSMLEWAHSHNLRLEAELLYWAKSSEHLSFAELGAAKEVATDEYSVNLESLGQLCGDWRDRTIYLSGPEPVCLKLYREMRDEGIPIARIKLDYFEGYFEI